ncbi:MAG: UDP-N-acetylmuramoyl-L-alanine--D-glutamate ligase, partial [Candidatus Adiutrix sp.]|nr:UDP-N-acetylmuramoyl-L-alanine--D-glutamate ligase [Candidatus Adiutrix sp.]
MSEKKLGNVLVVGAGVSGQWAAELLLERGAGVTISDQKNEDELSSAIDRFRGKPVRWALGRQAEEGFKNADLIVLSPGIPRTFPGLARAARKIKVTGEMELAASLLKVPVLAITGSNGKTTTTGLIGHICRKNRIPAFVGGNIGEPLSRFVVEGQKASAAVLEVSSYQLETVKLFHAAGAAITNISPDHLDRYPDMAEYFRAKTNVLINQTADDLAVINEDDILLRHKATVGRRFAFSRKKRQRFGAWVSKNEIIVAEGGREVAGISWADFKLEGVHNQENVMA